MGELKLLIYVLNCVIVKDKIFIYRQLKPTINKVPVPNAKYDNITNRIPKYAFISVYTNPQIPKYIHREIKMSLNSPLKCNQPINSFRL